MLAWSTKTEEQGSKVASRQAKCATRCSCKRSEYHFLRPGHGTILACPLPRKLVLSVLAY